MTKRIAVVTGGMGGLGEAISIKLHDAGFRGRRHAFAGQRERSANGSRAWIARATTFARIRVDVADYDSRPALRGEIQAEVGPIDILVNNAGITHDTTSRR